MRTHITLITLVAGTTFAAPAAKRDTKEAQGVQRRNSEDVGGVLSTAVAQESGVISTATSQILDPDWLTQSLAL